MLLLALIIFLSESGERNILFQYYLSSAGMRLIVQVVDSSLFTFSEYPDIPDRLFVCIQVHDYLLAFTTYEQYNSCQQYHSRQYIHENDLCDILLWQEIIVSKVSL